MSFDNLSERFIHRVWARDIAVVSSNLGQPYTRISKVPEQIVWELTWCSRTRSLA